MTEIVFEALTGSPQTLGTSSCVLPKLRVEGYEVADHGLAYLPDFTVTSAGYYQANYTGTSSCVLPGFRVFGNDTDGGTYNTYEGWCLAYLPGFTVYGTNVSAPIPQSGSGVVTLPLLTVISMGATHLIGTGSATLPRLGALGFEAAGNYGIAVLPSLSTVGYEVPPVVTNFFSLMQAPGQLTTYTSNAFFVTAYAGFDLSSTATTTAVFVLRDALNLTAAPTSVSHFAAALVDELGLTERVVLQAYAAISETITLNAVLTGDKLTLVSLVDTLVMTGAATGSARALALIAEVLALRDALKSVADETLADAVAFNQTLAVSTARYVALLETLAFSDVAAGRAIVTMLVDDTLTFDDTVTPIARLLAAIRDGLDFSVRFDLGDQTYVAYSMNASNKALSTYTNFNFDSLASFDGDTYATGTAGLYKLGGTTDAGTGIPWRIRTGLTNFNSGRNKGMDAAYLGYTATGRVVLKCIVVTPGTGAKIAHWYELQTPVAGATHPGRILTGRGLRSVYWAFELTNVDAGSFELDMLELHPVVFEGRLP